jgi:Dullard-like phosphatase family protein
MSKLFSGKKFFLKPIKQSNESYVNQSMQNILDSYSKNQGISKDFSSFNKNNITVDYPKHYSPSNRSPVSLPPISGKKRFANNSLKRPASKKLLNSNSSTNLYSQSLFGPGSKKFLEREKTQFNLIDNNLGKNKNNLNTIENLNNANLNNITQINNITNINIHIYQENLNKNDENLNKDEILEKNDPILNEPNNYQTNNIPDKIQNPLLKIKQNKVNNASASTFENAGMSIINPKINNNKKNNLNVKNKKVVKGNIKILPANPSSIYTNKSITNSLSSVGSLIINNNNNNINNKSKNTQRGLSHNKVNNNIKNISTSLPEINTGRSISINKKISNLDNDLLGLLKEENNIINTKDLENIDISMNFLKDLSNYNSTFVSFLQLIQTHMDIELLLDNTENNGNNLFRRKALNMINNDKIFKLNKLLNNFFNTLSSVYLKNNNNTNNTNNNNNNNKAPIDNFFLYQSINIIFHKCIKLQICLFCAMLVSLSQLNIYEINTMIKNHFLQIIKEILNPLLNIFETFIKEEINLNYPELVTINLRPDFNDHYNKLHKIQKYTHNYKNSELISLISKNLDKCVNSMKYYSTLNLKYSTIKPFGDALNQLLYTIDKKTLNQFSIIALKTLLFGELQENKNRAMRNCTPSNASKNIPNMNVGSSIINNIKDFPPFLPPINPKYKYTLVLDMDETLIHYFFTNVSGMFFVRPYCFDFLKELNDLYEIVTFTAGTKDYADNILNILDIDNNIIKYRLYRQHTTILGFSVYKDLTKLGRDLSKVIIIDNLKENFKMQPNNGIFIKTWTNDINDVQFKDLLKILKDIVIYNVNDVRTVIQKMNDEIKISRNIVRPYGNINIAKLIG